MTRPCVRCGRSIGEARSCRVCVGEIRLDHPEQWDDSEALVRCEFGSKDWRTGIGRADTFMDRPGLSTFPPRYSDHARQVNMHPDGEVRCVRDFLTDRALSPDAYMRGMLLHADVYNDHDGSRSFRVVEPHNELVFRAIDGWLYELTGDRPE